MGFGIGKDSTIINIHIKSAMNPGRIEMFEERRHIYS